MELKMLILHTTSNEYESVLNHYLVIILILCNYFNIIMQLF